MIVQLLSVADLFVAILLVYNETVGLTWFIAIYAAVYLLFKTAMYYTATVSWIDGLVGMYFIAIAFGAGGFISYVAAAWLFFKAASGLLFQKK